MGKPWKTKAYLTKRVRVPLEGGGFTSEYRQVEVALTVDIDWPRLAKVLGQKAFDNSSGRSKFLGGLIKVTANKGNR